MSDVPSANMAAKGPPPKGKGKGVPPPKGLGKGMPPPRPGGLGKGPVLPGGALHRPPSREAAGPRLRPLFWTAVTQVPAECVWADLVEPAPFDKALLERQFALAKVQTASSAKATSAPGSRSNSEEPRKRVRVLDDRTSQMLAIAFNRLPPPERVAEMVDTLEDFPDGLTSEAVLALHNAIAEHGDAVEQIRLVASNPDAVAQLDMPERFLLRLSAVEFCAAKLSCGALIVGSSKELTELRLSGQKVGMCCQDLQKSKLLQKCMSTALAVGNFLNRGTARSGVRAVVLPESLLKLEELRGSVFCDASGDGGDKEKSAAGTLLDFVAQAIVNEENSKEDDLQKEAENLLVKARAAAGVSLEETQASCNQISAEAEKVRESLRQVPPSEGAARMIQRVNTICEEAALAVDIAGKAKDQLAKAQLWSCCKGKVKCHDWFASWAQFLELLPRALTRAQEAKARRLAQAEAEQRALTLLGDANTMVSTSEDPAKRRCRELRSLVQGALAPSHSRVGQEALAQTRNEEPQLEANCQSSSRTSSRGKAKALDDDARFDSIDWAKVNQMRQENASDPIKRHSEPAVGTTFNDKENPLP